MQKTKCGTYFSSTIPALELKSQFGWFFLPMWQIAHYNLFLSRFQWIDIVYFRRLKIHTFFGPFRVFAMLMRGDGGVTACDACCSIWKRQIFCRCHAWKIVIRHTDLGLGTLSRTPLAQFSWESKPDIRSSGFTATYLLEMFFSTREKCCYMLIFANECAVLIKVFINVFEATPFFAVLYRWRKYEILAFNILHLLHSLSSGSSFPLSHFKTFKF